MAISSSPISARSNAGESALSATEGRGSMAKMPRSIKIYEIHDHTRYLR
jgi:hypothetical protein